MRRWARQLVLAAGIVVLLVFLWYSRRVLLLAFSGMLISLVFTSIINRIRRFIPLKQGVGVAIVLLLFMAAGALIGWWIAPGLADEFTQLAEQLPKKADEVMRWLEKTPVLEKIKSSAPEVSSWFPQSIKAAGKVKTIFTSTLDTVASLFLVAFVALFLAADPGLYRGMALNLVPARRRADAAAILQKIICTLKYWLLGQFISMCLVGLLVGVAFALCGLPMSAALGVLAGIAEFIPFIGPTTAAIPALLLALSSSGKLFLIVLVVFMAIQFIEAHFLMPIVQHQTVDLPPVATLLAVFLPGKAFGLLGMFIAAPLTAVMIVLIEEIYIKRYLRENRSLIPEKVNSAD